MARCHENWRKANRRNQREALTLEQWKEQNMPGGSGAYSPVSRKPDQYDRMGNQRTSPAPSRNGSPSYPDVKMTGNTVKQGHEIERASIKTKASDRVSRYTGPDGTNFHRGRGPISYKDQS